MRPQAFNARFTPRSEGIAEIIKNDAEDARADLAVYDGETKITLDQFLGKQKEW